jgi:hypothetical protein
MKLSIALWLCTGPVARQAGGVVNVKNGLVVLE